MPFLMTHKISEIPELPNDKVVTICGLITTARQIPTKKDPTKFIRFVTIEDLSGKIDVICFNRQIQEYGSFLDVEQRTIISGKVSRRGDDEPPVLIVDSVKPVDNSNIFTIKDDFKFEELVYMKNLLCEHAGSDPLMIKLKDDSGDVKILTASMFWVNSSNTLVSMLKNKFNDRININVRSLDAQEEPAEVA